MSANVETMFYTREKPWHGLGSMVAQAQTSKDAIRLAGLDWGVVQKAIFMENGDTVPEYLVNVRDVDGMVLGVVTKRYKVIQNKEAFDFTDRLLGEGVRYETAGSLQQGRRIWLLAKMPEEYKVLGDAFATYLVFSNSHDGTGAVRVAVTPVRVVCNNTLNLALSTAKRNWSTPHKGDIREKIQEAGNTLLLASSYVKRLRQEAEELHKKKLTRQQVEGCIKLLLPGKGDSVLAKENNRRVRGELRWRYYSAPDLKDMGHTAYRFVNAVSDFATHTEPLRRTVRYRERRFEDAMDGSLMIDKAYKMMQEV